MEIGSTQDEVAPAAPYTERIGAGARVRHFLARHSSFFNRWSEANLVCPCTTACVSCLGTTALGLLLPLAVEGGQALTERHEPQDTQSSEEL